MSRRDTIIIAVLINAGLLIVLFASALKSNSTQEEFVVKPTAVSEEISGLAFKKEAVPVSGDEIDVALNQFAQTSAATATTPVQIPTPAPLHSSNALSSSVSSTSNFAEDLKAIGIPEISPSTQVKTPSAQTLMAPVKPQNTLGSEFTEIKVKKGDVLEKIARHHQTTVAEIMKANKLTSSNLRIGQVLKIPNKAIKKAAPSTLVFSPQEATASNESRTKYYTVKKGDNPWTIAVKNHIKVEDLLKLNNMSEDQARRLKPGDQLRIQ